jgi:GTP cyclohydrolase II
LHLGFDDDLRDYSVAAAMLHALGVASIVLHTNNLRKIEGLRAGGVEVHHREAIIAASREQNARLPGDQARQERAPALSG